MSEGPDKKIDEEWKERVRREREASERPPREGDAASEEPTDEPRAEAGAGQEEATGQGTPSPPASFSGLVLSLYMQALMALGAMEDPVSKKREKNLPHAKYSIDLLGVLEEKTRGNLSPDEEQLLEANLFQLRMQYVKATEEKA